MDEFSRAREEEEEQELLRAYKSLNTEGKFLLMNQARYLSGCYEMRLYKPDRVKQAYMKTKEKGKDFKGLYLKPQE